MTSLPKGSRITEDSSAGLCPHAGGQDKPTCPEGRCALDLYMTRFRAKSSCFIFFRPVAFPAYSCCRAACTLFLFSIRVSQACLADRMVQAGNIADFLIGAALGPPTEEDLVSEHFMQNFGPETRDPIQTTRFPGSRPRFGPLSRRLLSGAGRLI